MSDSCHERPKNSKIADFLDTVQNIQTCKKVCFIGLRAYINIIFLVFLFIKKANYERIFTACFYDFVNHLVLFEVSLKFLHSA
ncbi:hypothetical protein AB336_04365 [Listeria monocytogenes]|nr:hypothetical protein [Listeria monocytogenes]